MESQPLSFCFFNGQYVHQPYKLTIEGRELRLNRHLILEYPPAMVQYGKSLHQATLPVLDARLNENSSWEDIRKIRDGVGDWGASYFMYFFSHYEPEDALQRARNAFLKLPFVASSEIVPAPPEFGASKRLLSVKTKAGDERDFLATWLRREDRTSIDKVYDLPDARLYSREFIHKQLVERQAHWNTMLAEAKIIIINEIGSIQINRHNERRKWESIVNIVEILNSGLSTKEKRREIIQQLADPKDLEGDYDEGTNNWKKLTQLVEKFTPDEQLTSRITKLRDSVTVPLWEPPAK